MTNKELKEKLREKDLKVSGKKSELIKRCKENDIPLKEKESSKEEVEEEKTEKTKEVAVDVVDENGKYVRTYEKKRHGKDFKKLAKEFSKKYKFKVVKRDPSNPNK